MMLFDEVKQLIEECRRLRVLNAALEQVIKNIANGKIGRCCCPEEYALKMLRGKSDA